MYLQLLLARLEAISPEAKFFLLKFLQYYRLEQPVVFSSREMVKRFGLPDKTIKKVLDELCGRKYLSRSSLLTGARGRPKHKLVVEEELVKALSLASAPIAHAQIIEKLLEVAPERQIITKPRSCLSRNDNTGKDRTQKFLTNTRKLLLCTLLAKADQFGVVRDLGMSELASLVGISKEQLRRHLKILNGSQYLTDYIPGTAARGIKGKLKSIFVLTASWFTGEGDSRAFFKVHDSDALRLLKQSLFVVYALESLNGSSGNGRFKELSKGHFAWLASTFNMTISEVEEIVDSAQILGALGGPEKTGYRRLSTFVCELAVMLLGDHELIGSARLSEKEVIRVILLEGMRRKLKIALGRAALRNMKGVIWLSKLVLRLCNELREVAVQSIGLNESLEVKLHLLTPLASTTSVRLHLSKVPSQNKE